MAEDYRPRLDRLLADNPVAGEFGYGRPKPAAKVVPPPSRKVVRPIDLSSLSSAGGASGAGRIDLSGLSSATKLASEGALGSFDAITPERARSEVEATRAAAERDLPAANAAQDQFETARRAAQKDFGVETPAAALPPRFKSAADVVAERARARLTQADRQLGTVNPDDYETHLNPAEEQQFQEWKKTAAPQDSGEDYDLRGAFKAGLQPDQATGHWPDTFKKPNHPTFSDQSIYAKERPDLAGHWEGETYTPAAAGGGEPLPKFGKTRDFIDRAIAAVGSGAAQTVKGVGILAGAPGTVPWLMGVREKNALTEAGDIAEKAVKGAFPGDPERADQFMSQLGSGTGSMAFFMVSGLAMKTFGVAAGMSARAARNVGVAGVGALSQATQGYEDAAQHEKMTAEEFNTGKADPVAEHTRAFKRYLSFYANAALGATEAAPIDRFFGRLNEATGGRVADIILHSQAQGLEELIQEVGQQIGQNEVARILYDPERPLAQGAAQQGAVGFILGALMGGAGGAFAGRADDTAEAPGGAPRRPPLEGDIIPPERGPTPPPGVGERPTIDLEATRNEPVQPMRGTPGPAGPEILPQLPPPLSEGVAPQADGGVSPPASDVPRGTIDDIRNNPLQPPGAIDLSELSSQPLRHSGARQGPALLAAPEDLARAEARVATETSEAERAAGNYQMGHARWHNLPITITTATGGVRRGKTASGDDWEVVMPVAHGYFKRTKAKDGEQVDVFVGPNPKSPHVFLLDQIVPETGKYDEAKALVGFDNREEALRAYDGSFSDGRARERIGAVSQLPVNAFKVWLRSGSSTKPYDRKGVAEVRRSRQEIGRGVGMDPTRMMKRHPMLSALRNMGGVDPTSALAGELRHMGVTDDFVAKTPALKGLFQAAESGGMFGPGRSGGRGSVDNFPASEWSAFFPEGISEDNNGYIPKDTFLEAIRDELAGNPRRTAEDQARIDTHRAAADERNAGVDEVALDAALREMELAGDESVRRKARELMAAGEDVDSAVDHAIHQATSEDESREDLAIVTAETGIPFFGDEEAVDRGAGAQGGAELPQAGAERAGPGQEEGASPEPQAVRGPRQLEGEAGESRPAGIDLSSLSSAGKPATERTAAGEQQIIPGAERISTGEEAQRGADKPLQPKRAQESAEGLALFGDQSKQTDLLDAIAKPERPSLAAINAEYEVKVSNLREAVMRALDADGIYVAQKGDRAVTITRSNRAAHKLQITYFSKGVAGGHIESSADGSKLGQDAYEVTGWERLTGRAAEAALEEETYARPSEKSESRKDTVAPRDASEPKPAPQKPAASRKPTTPARDSPVTQAQLDALVAKYVPDFKGRVATVGSGALRSARVFIEPKRGKPVSSSGIPNEYGEVIDTLRSIRRIGGSPDTQFSMRRNKVTQKRLDEYAQTLKDLHGLSHLSLHVSSLHRSTITLDAIEVAKPDRRRGKGSAALADIAEFADANDLRVILTPALKDDRHGTTSRSRLVTFYKRFGFVQNRGRNKDFSISEGMIREPRKPSARRDQTETPEFKRWFGKSKVVDARGNPLVVYHGTSADFNEFKTGIGGMTEGGSEMAAAGVPATFFTDSADVAGGFAEGAVPIGGGGRDNIMPVYLRIERPYIIHANGAAWPKFSREIIEAYKSAHDGVILHRVDDGMFDPAISTVYIVFKPTQIKSAIGNRGTFDSNDPRISYKMGTKGALKNAEVQARVLDIIRKVAGDDVATEFADKIVVDPRHPGRAAWGDVQTPEVAGSANAVNRLIQISLNPDFDTDNTAYHEAFHIIQGLKTAKEASLFKREMARLRTLAAADLGISKEKAAGLDEREVEAIAFAAYEQGRVKGMHIGVRAFFEKLARILRQIANLIRGLGFKTAEDFFDAAAAGEVRTRGMAGDTGTELLPAWHGSPFRFSKFSLEHMGKGEGAQAYGWGLYFADKKEVGEYYRDKLARGLTINGTPVGAEYRDIQDFVTRHKRSELGLPSLTRLPKGYSLGTDRMMPPDRRWHIIPPGQIHAAPFAGKHPTEEAAIAAALDSLSYIGSNLGSHVGMIVMKAFNAGDLTRAGVKKAADEYVMNQAVYADDLQTETNQRRSDVGGTPEEDKAWVDEFVRQAEDAATIAEGLNIERSKGALYRVEIPEDDTMLLWDKPLSEQPEKVKAALEKVGVGIIKPTEPPSDPVIAQIVKEALRQTTDGDTGQTDAYQVGLMVDNDQKLYSAALKHAKDAGIDTEEFGFAPGEYVEEAAQLYLNSLKRVQNLTGERFYKDFTPADGGPKAASLALRDAGISGIRYIDQDSRSVRPAIYDPGSKLWRAERRSATGELIERDFKTKAEAEEWSPPQTYNYVIFDDAAVEILEQFSMREKRPVFYSAVVKSVENAKITKGPADHWLGYLRAQPGVKEEELAWLGVEDWLRAQTGTVTKDALADFVRANQVEVRDVVRSGEDPSEMEVMQDEDSGDWGIYNRETGAHIASAYATAAEAEAELARRVPDPMAPAKFASYQLPGGENYRELLLTLPDASKTRPQLDAIRERMDAISNLPAAQHTAELTDEWDKLNAQRKALMYDAAGNIRNEVHPFTTSHWEDEPNVLAHVRFNERTDADGKRTLFIEEVQSDWHQAGRKQGYQGQTLTADETELRALNAKSWQDGLGLVDQDRERHAELTAKVGESLKAKLSGVPDAPFKTTWPELAMKRMIRWAAENGFDQVAWTPGSVQADRYDLSKHIDSIVYSPEGQSLRAYKGQAKVIDEEGVKPEQLADYIGKDAADRIINNPTTKTTGLHKDVHVHELTGLDLKVGGEGMAGFYDKILPSVANKLGKKFGAKVGTTFINQGPQIGEPSFDGEPPGGTKVHALPITDAMRDSVMEGQTLFSMRRRPPVDQNAKFGMPGDPVRVSMFLRSITSARFRNRYGLGLGDTQWRMKFQDREIYWKRNREAILAEEMESRGIGGNNPPEDMRTMPEEYDIYQAMTVYRSKTGKKLQDFLDNRQTPFINYMNRKRIARAAFDRYLRARHAEERNRDLRYINPTIADPSGMSDQDAKDYLDEVHNSRKGAAFIEAAKMFDRIRREAMQTMLDGDLIDQETFDAWSRWKFYAPLRGFEEDPESAATLARTGRGFDIQRPEARQALGRESDPDSPLAYMFQQAAQAIVRSAKNEVDQRIYGLIHNYPNKEVWEPDPEGFTRVFDPVKRAVVIKKLNPQATARADEEHVFGVKFKGKQFYFAVHHDGLARGVRGMSMEDIGPFTRLLDSFNRYRRGVITGLSPEFWETNVIRDVQEAIINVSAVRGKKWLRTRIIADLPAAVLGKRGPLAKWANDFEADGGRIFGYGVDSIQRFKDKIDDALRTGAWANTKRGFMTVIEAIEAFNGYFENAIRLSAYKNLVQSGWSREKAAAYAKELTVNFDRKGEWGTALNAYKLFYNARFQSTVRMAQALKHKRVRRIVYGMVVIGFINEMMNYMMAGDDDDGMNKWDKIPQYQKTGRISFAWLPGDPGWGFPTSYGFGFFVSLGADLSAFMRYQAGMGRGRSPMETVADLYNDFMNAVSPIDAIASGHLWPFIMRTIAPSVADPVITIATNENSLGRPATPPNYNREPNSELAFSNEDPNLVWIAKHLNTLTGGDEFEPGFVDVAPGWLHEFVTFATGGIGRFAEKVSADIGHTARGERWPARDVPFNRFYYPVDDRVNQSIYYDLRERVQIAEKRVNAGGDAATRAETRTPVEYAVIEDFNEAEKTRLRANKEMRALEQEDIPEADKRTQREELQTEINDAMRDARAAWEAAREAYVNSR